MTNRRAQLHDAIDNDYDSIAALTTPPDIGDLAKTIATELDLDPAIVRAVLARRPAPALDAMRDLHHRVVMIELDNPSTPDGYPTTAIGAAPSTGTAPYVPEDERGVDQPTERAVIALARPHRDEYRRRVADANGYLADAARALRAANNCLRWCIDKPADTIDPGVNRQVCAVMKRVGVEEPVAHRIVDADGHAIPLGAWAYKFRHSHRRLPTDDEARQHAKGRRVMVRVA